MREVVVVSGARTAIGTFGGSLKDIPPTQLGAIVVAEALKRASVQGAEVGHVVFGHVDQHRTEGHVPGARRCAQRRRRPGQRRA